MTDIKNISDRNKRNEQIFKHAGIDPYSRNESFGTSFMKIFKRCRKLEDELARAQGLLSTFSEGSAKEAVKRIQTVLEG